MHNEGDIIVENTTIHGTATGIAEDHNTTNIPVNSLAERSIISDVSNLIKH